MFNADFTFYFCNLIAVDFLTKFTFQYFFPFFNCFQRSHINQIIKINPFTSGLYLGFPLKKVQCFGVKVLSIWVIKEMQN